jgi:hypothetical protein
VKLPGDEVAVYPVIVAPPLLTGAVNATVADVIPAVAVPIVGASGTVVAAPAVYVIVTGSVNPPLLVTAIVLAPVLAGVYVNVPVGDPVVRFTEVGVNVPPAALSFGVTITVPVMAPPFGDTPNVKLVDATLTVPVVGPVTVTADATDATLFVTDTPEKLATSPAVVLRKLLVPG